MLSSAGACRHGLNLNFCIRTDSKLLLSPSTSHRLMLGLGLRSLRPPISPFCYASIPNRPVAVRSFIRLATQQYPLPLQSRQHRITLSPPLPIHVVKKTLLGIRHASELSSVPPLHSIRQITQAEAEADADPDNVEAQLKLFRMLLESSRPAGRNVLISRWERMCEFVSTILTCRCSSSSYST